MDQAQPTNITSIPPRAGSDPRQDDELTAHGAAGSDAMLLIDPVGLVRMANPAASRLFGRPLAELIDQPFGFPLAAGVATDLEILRPDGAVVFAELRVEPRLWRGQLCSLASLHDITGRKRAEQLLIEAQQLLRSALDALSAQIAILDGEGRLAAVNDAWRAFAREHSGAVVGDRYLPPGNGDPEEQAVLAAGVAAILRGERTQFAGEYVVEDEQGRRWFALHAASCGEGRWARAVVAHEEITARKLAERLDGERRRILELIARQQSIEQVAEALLALAAERYPDLRYAALRLPAAGLHTTRSRWLLAAECQALDRWVDAGDDADPAGAAGSVVVVEAARLPALVQGLGCWVARLPLRPGAMARLILCRGRGTAPGPADDDFVATVGQLLAIALEQHEHNRRLAHQAHHDPLTELPNRMRFDDRLRQAIEAARRNGQMVGVLFIDLDRFKQINDSLGHAAGDALLIQLARRLEQAVRSVDTLARRGGDEFMLVLPGVASPLEVTRVAGRLHDLLRQPFVVGGHELFVSASIGAALFPADGEDADTLQRNADAAMYRAKHTLRNSFQLFDASANSATLERLRLESSLRRAVERCELAVHYQPKVDRAGRLVGAEALLRWAHPELGDISPARFIPLAEELGLIVPLGEWCLNEVCRQLNAWERPGRPPLTVAVNISAVQFAQPEFLSMLTRTLSSSGVNPGALELELTESMLMGDVTAVTALLERLRGLGLSLAIDDFGTGYSSLGYLHRLPIGVLKVDRSFVGRVGGPGDTGDRGIVSAIITLGHHLQMQLVAEGVETEAQRSFLLEQGCDLFQGFLFSRALPPERFETFLT